jgi:DNA-binding transcriptional MerR regulator
MPPLVQKRASTADAGTLQTTRRTEHMDMHCEEPSFFLDADTVWVDADSPWPPASHDTTFTIGEFAEKFSVTPRALRFYESKGLLSPRREGEMRLYGQEDGKRLALILKAKRLGFTLTEISRMIDAQEEGRVAAHALKLSRRKCREQISLLEGQLQEVQEALAELQRIHAMLPDPAPQAGDACR